MQLRKALRKAAKLRIAFSAVSGAGKTYGSLLCAYGLTGDWSKIALIDSENGSADLYADLGDYNVLTLTTPHSPERYIEAIDSCEKAGMEVIIIDSISHEWDFLLNVHGNMTGNSFTNWAKITPRHDKFKNKILQSPCHILTTVRRKTEYEMDQSGGKTVISKIGTKEQTREGWDYENTLVFEVDDKHFAKATKDRTGLFIEQDPFKITIETGEALKNWANKGATDTEVLLQAGLVELNNIVNMQGLTAVWVKFPELQKNETFKQAAKAKKELFGQKVEQ